jgi:hypothetical protein
LEFPAPKNSKIIVYDSEVKASREDVRKLKDILDKLKIHHIIDDISFHANDAMVDLMKYSRSTNVWKVEKDGGVSLKNRFGHSNRFRYRTLCIPSLIEFLFADMDALDSQEACLLDALIKETSHISIVDDPS